MVRKCGIYKIQSIIKPERIYVGSAVYFASRWGIHRMQLRNGKHHSKKLQRHFNKYGEEDLQFCILLECSRDELIQKEQFFIDSIKPYFNSSPIAGSQLGFKQSEESKRKNSISKKGHKYWVGKTHKEESKEKMRAAKLGRKLSEETRKKLSIARLGNKNALGGKGRTGKTLSIESRNKISDGLKQYFSSRRGNGNLDLFG